MTGERVELDSGKYTFYLSNAGTLRCDRYREAWRQFLGDHAVHSLFDEVLRLRAELAKPRSPAVALVNTKQEEICFTYGCEAAKGGAKSCGPGICTLSDKT